MSIIPLNKTHREQVLEILASCKLPTADIDMQKQVFFGYQNSNRLTGIGALELFEENALLRSMAVLYSNQKKGLGSRLVTRLIEEAQARQVKNIYLLTESATIFFEKHGFIQTSRNEVPEAVLQSTEFKKLCPVTATCMLYAVAK